MTTEKQVAANRENALKSTGPTTAAGKAAVSCNAVRHGLLAVQAILPTEDETEYAAFETRLCWLLRAVGDLEWILVGRIISCAWRLRRAMNVETGLFAVEHADILADRAAAEAGHAAKSEDPGEAAPGLPAVRETTAAIDPELRESVEAARETRDKANFLAATLGLAFRNNAKNGDAFGRLSRYEAALERSLYKALHELQRLQRARYLGSLEAYYGLPLEMQFGGVEPRFDDGRPMHATRKRNLADVAADIVAADNARIAAREERLERQRRRQRERERERDDVR
jgi:hypothetical protein